MAVPIDAVDPPGDAGPTDGGDSDDVAAAPDVLASDVDAASDSTYQPRGSDAWNGDRGAIDGSSGGTDVASEADVGGLRADVLDRDGEGDDVSGDPSADRASAGAIRGGGGCATVGAREGTLGAATIAGLALLLGAALGRKRRRPHAYVSGLEGKSEGRAH